MTHNEKGFTAYELMVVILAAVFGLTALTVGGYIAYLVVQALNKYIAS